MYRRHAGGRGGRERGGCWDCREEPTELTAGCTDVWIINGFQQRNCNRALGYPGLLYGALWIRQPSVVLSVTRFGPIHRHSMEPSWRVILEHSLDRDWLPNNQSNCCLYGKHPCHEIVQTTQYVPCVFGVFSSHFGGHRHSRGCTCLPCSVPVNVSKHGGKKWPCFVPLTKHKDYRATYVRAAQQFVFLRDLYWNQWGEQNTEQQDTLLRERFVWTKQQQSAEWCDCWESLFRGNSCLLTSQSPPIVIRGD